MLKLCMSIETKTYYYNKGYYIDIVKEHGVYSAWLYHNSTGDKMYMFGIPVDTRRLHTTLEDMIDMVEGNIDSYISVYRETFKEDFD